MSAETRERLVESVARSERELRRAVDELGDAARSRFDLGERLAARPWPWLGAAVALGLWLGTRERR